MPAQQPEAAAGTGPPAAAAAAAPAAQQAADAPASADPAGEGAAASTAESAPPSQPQDEWRWRLLSFTVLPGGRARR